MIYDSDEPRLTDPIDPHRDHMLGPAQPSAALVEYGDYECPRCEAAHREIKELLARSAGKLLYVFRHFPLTQIHRHALMAAEAAEAAAGQEKFWEMHDLLFTNQDELDPESLLRHAESLGLDGEQFLHNLTGHAFTQKLRDDYRSGMRSGVNGTPTFFLNGVRLNGTQNLDSLAEAIDAAA